MDRNAMFNAVQATKSDVTRCGGSPVELTRVS
jgi:hypothetical protein